MFGFTYPSGTHYTTQGTHCHGNIVPGPQPDNQGRCSKKATDVTQSVERRHQVHFRLVRRSALVHHVILYMLIQWMHESTAQLHLLVTAESFSLEAVVSRLPAGCFLEGATLWLISGQWFGPKRARSGHQWAHFLSSSHSHARPLPSYESAHGEWESEKESERKEVILPASGPSPVSSPANSE